MHMFAADDAMAGIGGRGPCGVDSQMARHGLIGANKQWSPLTSGGLLEELSARGFPFRRHRRCESGAAACPTINHLLALDQCNATRGRPEGFAVRLASSGRIGGRRRVSFEFFPVLASRCFLSDSSLISSTR